MGILTRAMAGPSAVCKTVRQGFDSLPRLQLVWRGANGTKRYPQDYTRREIINLAVWHWLQHIEASTEASNLRERLKEAQKELSVLKRARG